MAEKKIQTRIRQKVDTKANWDKATNFVPLKGEIIIYSDLNQAKIGDGTTKVGALPFLKGKADAIDKNPTLAWGSKSTVATVDGVDIHVTMPSNPNTHQSIKALNTNNTSAQTVSSSEAIAGSGTINLHKVAKTGSYNDLNNKPTIPTVPNNIVKYTEATAEVAGTKKTLAAVSPSALYVANGLIMGGTAAAAGLVTRGICGVTTPESTGACTKENLYLNYDGDNNYSRKVVLGAGSPGDSIAGGATTLSAVRGDQMVGYVNSLALIKSGKQTTTSTADGGSNVYTFTDTKGATSTFTVKNGSKGSTGSQGPQGPIGTAAGFGTPTASVDANVGTPSVTITSSGPNTAKVFNFTFKNLKGATGGIGPQGPEGPRGPQGPQGEKGATGSVASLTNSGSGNVVTDVSLNTSTKVLTVTKNKTLATVATSGSYTDLANKPTIPTVPTNFVTTNTEQYITGKKFFEEEVGFGDYVGMSRTVAAAPTNLDFVNFQYRSGAINNALILSGAGDYFYLAHRKPDFSIKASFEGNGETSDTYSASLGYTRGWLDYLTDWDYGTAWCVRPDKVSATTPAIIQIKFTRLLYTDVLRLILTGHNLQDSSGNNSGFLDNYTIEVCTNKDQDTWTTVVNRSNANDNIGKGLMYSLQTASYTECYGIRLKITKCHVTGQGAPFIRISTIQLRDYRPAIKFPDCLGVVSQDGGDVWGSLKTKNNLVTHAVFPELNDSWSLGDQTHQYAGAYAGCFYENHIALSDKYLAKSEVSTQQWKLTSTAGTVTTVNICVK